VIRLDGRALHSGRAAAIELSRIEGPSAVFDGDHAITLAHLSVSASDRASVLTLPSGHRVATIEHVFAALVGLSAFDGIGVRFFGDEAPLLDGGASQVAAAVLALEPPETERRAVIEKPFVFSDDDACYRFEPSADIRIDVDVDYPPERFGVALVGSASFSGDPSAFVRDIAPSRTFGAARELIALRARGLSAHVPEGSVVALDLPDEPGRAPRDRLEPVRHKLLDLLGDLAVLGAPLRGRLHVRKPSHAMTAKVVACAREKEVFATQLTTPRRRPGT
jgi:UDP-3-O-[3-hydroxymyristoyl] N-acetylglucosamine deacetylase